MLAAANSEGPAAHFLAKLHVGSIAPTDVVLPILNAAQLLAVGEGCIALIRSEQEGATKTGKWLVRVAVLGDMKTGPIAVTCAQNLELTPCRRADLKRLWDLSSGEMKVLELTFRGQTVQEAAKDLGISVDTVRTHMRHIYTKVGVNSREALFAALGPIFC